MSFIAYLTAGFFSGMLGGMGMGGGTLLIPVLTAILGVNQHVSQAANLISFLPMAAFSLKIHRDSGNLQTQGIWAIVLPALITSVAGAVAASFLPADVLRKMFGIFLIALAVRGLFNLKK